MKKDTKIFIQHILDSTEKIEDFTKGMGKKDFLSSAKTQAAVIRQIEIIGEASKNIPNEFKKKYSEVPWSEMARTRDKLIHGYFGVDLNLTWDIVERDLPDLKEKIIKLLKEVEK